MTLRDLFLDHKLNLLKKYCLSHGADLAFEKGGLAGQYLGQVHICEGAEQLSGGRVWTLSEIKVL